MYLQDMMDELVDQFSMGPDPGQAVLRRFQRNLNTAYREILTKKGFASLRRKVLPFTSVSGSPFAVLPQAASRIVVIADRTNKLLLDECSLQEIRWDDPGLASTTSVPSIYVIENMAAPVARDPSAAAELFVKSTSALDGTGVDVTVNGVITGGYERDTHAAMNGVTAVTIDASITTWEQIKRFRLNELASGTVTLHETSGAGTELARIPIGRSSARYTRIMLHPVPSVAVTYYADVELFVDGLASPYDEPCFNEDWHWLLPCGAMMREYQKKEKHTEYANEKGRWDKGIAGLQAFVAKKSGVSSRTDRPRRFSQLGSNFPAGS